MQFLSIGERIKQYRNISQITQEELGKRIGVSAKTISAYEVGRNEPDLETISLLAKALQTTTTDLLGEVATTQSTSTQTRAIRIHPNSYEELLKELQTTINQGKSFDYQGTTITWVDDCFEINHQGDNSRADLYDGALNIVLALNNVIVFNPKRK